MTSFSKIPHLFLNQENFEKHRNNSFKYRGVVEAIQDSVHTSTPNNPGGQIEKYKIHTVQSVDFFEEEKKTLDLQKLASFQKLKSLFKNRADQVEYEIEIKPREVQEEEVFTDEVKNIDLPALEIYKERSTTSDGQNNNNTLEVFEPSENPVLFSPSTEFEKIKENKVNQVNQENKAQWARKLKGKKLVKSNKSISRKKIF